MLFFVLLKKLAFGRKAADDQPSVTEDELKTIIDTVEEEGVLDSQETDIIQSVIDFDDITVQEILIPRVDMLAVDVNDPVDQIIATVLANSYTRIPVYENDIDHIIGMLHTRDLFSCLAQNKPVNVRELCRDIPFVYRTKHINDLLAELRRKKQHMAIVTDDYGGTLGLVTMEDVLEELVGEIFDETDAVEDNSHPEAGGEPVPGSRRGEHRRSVRRAGPEDQGFRQRLFQRGRLGSGVPGAHSRPRRELRVPEPACHGGKGGGQAHSQPAGAH